MTINWLTANHQTLSETEVGIYIAVGAEDSDGAFGSSITYQIIGGLDQALFEFGPSGLVFKPGIIGTWTGYESGISLNPHEYNVEVRAIHDYFVNNDPNQHVHIESDRAFTLHISDVAPREDAGLNPAQLFVSETAPVGDVIYAWNANLSGDGRGPATVTLTDGSNGKFQIVFDADSGTYFLKVLDPGGLDYETQVGPLTVGVNISDGTTTVVQTYNITVTDTIEGNAPPAFGAGYIGNRTINENLDSVFFLATDSDNDALTFSLADSADKDKFTLSSTGGTARLDFKTAANFEAPADADHNGVYVVKLTVSDGTHSVTEDVNIVLANVDEAVAITSDASGKITVKENIRAVTTVAAADPDAGAAITYSLVTTSNSPDAARFEIDATTGALSFISAPDFETRADANHDNKYVVIVKATSGSFIDTQTLVVTVANDDAKPQPSPGTAKADKLNGTASEEKLDGKAGNDTIKALAGGDTIIGGKGADKLYGGVDGVADTFKFVKGESGTTATTWDKLYDFVSGIDRIDLSGIDGDPAKGQQDLRFVEKFKAPGNKTDGQFRLVDAGKHVNIEIDLDGNKKADMVIQVMNVDHLLATDFIL